MQSYKSHFSRFAGANAHRHHFAAHSHHYWPDVTRDAHLRAWDDAASLVDDKWGMVLGPVLERARTHAAGVIGGSPEAIAFAPNVHDLLVRIASGLPRPMRILSTDAEFHSFSRQARRWEEAGFASWHTVPSEPFDTLPERFAAAAQGDWDLVYTSDVFFDSGYHFREAASILADVDAVCVIDGYHSYMAVPVDHSRWKDRVFYLGGGYKYAMAGEGACFVHAPPDRLPRPVDTGWFAAFSALATVDGAVPYGTDGSRFMGATFDPTALYRLVAVADWLEEIGLDVPAMHARSLALQARFVEGLADIPLLDAEQLVVTDPARRGNFVTFRRPDATALQQRLHAAGIVTDARRDRLRFGFGLYHDPEDVDRLLDALRALG